MMLLVLSYLLLSSVSVSGSNSVVFSGFIEDGTYYTNGDAVTELTCNANYNDVIIANRTWFYERSGSDEDTGSSVIRFGDVVNESPSVWGETRMYYCRAVNEDQNNYTMLVRSGSITLIVQYNTSISISYNTVTHVLYSMDVQSIAIPVMTQNVVLSCGVASAEWSYRLQGSNKLESSPLTIDLFTIENDTNYFCKDSHGRIVRSVSLFAIGGGIWQLEGSSYTAKADDDVITLREDVSLVCVTNDKSTGLTWNFRGESNTGSGERVNDNTETNINRGFVTLNISQSLPANRTGYYYCLTRERRDSSMELFSIEHSIKVVLPTEMTTSMLTAKPITTTTTVVATQVKTTPRTTSSPPTSSPTTSSPTTSSPITSSPITPSLSLSFSYTPEFEVVFVGVDDVTLLCVASSMTSSYLSVSIRDEGSGEEVISETGSEDLRVEFRVQNYTAGVLTYTCVTNISTEERSVTIDARDVYEQEVTNLLLFEASGRLEWNTAYDTIAREEFIISVNSLNESTGWKEVARTNDTFYILEMLIPGNHYEIRVRVTNRLNATNSFTLSYVVPTQSFAQPINISSILIPVIVLLALGVLVLLLVSVLLVAMVKIRRRKSKHTDQSNEYIQLSTVNTGKSSRHKSATSKNKEYVPLQLMDPSNRSPLKSEMAISEEVSVTADIKSLKHPSETLNQSFARDKVSNNIPERQLPVNSTPSKGYHELDIDGSNSDDTYCTVAYEMFTSNKLSPNKPDVLLDDLKQHIDTMWSNGMLGLRREFDELQLNLMRASVQTARLSCNIKFNRDTMMLPYDRYRVRLTAADTSDYINASLIPGPFTQQTFIAAQLPMHATSDRFWSMLWEQKVTTVLMVSTRQESDHMYRYWPPVSETQMVGELKVRTVSVEDTEEVLVSHCISLSLSSSPKQVRELVLLEFRGWPENEHCMMSHDILRCVRGVRDRIGVKGLRGVKSVSDEKKKVSPICVCCVTGSGRTGAMISVYNLLECVESGSGSVSVFNCVNGMRNHRPYMVQTLNQYRMLYTGLLEMVAGDTRVDVNTAFLSEDMVVKEFTELEYQCEKSFERCSNVGVVGTENSDTPLHYDDTRVILDGPLHTSYYNASYIRSAARDEFIAAVSPRSEEVSQLMEIVFQHKCPLVVALGVHSIKKLARYWEFTGIVKLERLRMKKLSSIEMEGLFICELELELVSGESHTFQHVYCSTWTSAGVSSRYSSVLKLLDILLQCEDRTHPVLVHCEDGAGVSGMLLAVWLGVKGRKGCEVDLFQACKHLRFHRRRMVSTTEQYRICYEILKRYFEVKLDKNYANLADIS